MTNAFFVFSCLSFVQLLRRFTVAQAQTESHIFITLICVEFYPGFPLLILRKDLIVELCGWLNDNGSMGLRPIITETRIINFMISFGRLLLVHYSPGSISLD